MRIIRNLLLLTIIFISACSPTKKILTIESDISNLYQQEQYQKILLQYDKLKTLCSQNNLPINDNTKISAAIAANKTENYEQSITIFNSIDSLYNPEVILTGSENFEKTYQFKEGLDYLNQHINKFKGSNLEQTALLKLYRLQQQIEDYEAANKTWIKIDYSNNTDLMFEQITVLTKLNKKKDALALCNELLKIDNSHEQALFWKADYYYNKAEKWYQNEMAKYNRDANYTAYAYLRRELKKISANFRTARDLLITLHNIDPNNKKYLGYLINTYVRLDMKSEVEKTKKKLKAL